MNRIKLTVNELFSGLGAQKRGIDLTGLFDCEIVSTSDIDKDVMVSYAAIHCGLTKELINTYSNYPSRKEMAKYLTERNIGYDFKNNKPYDWYKHIKQKNKTLEKYYLACILTKNLGDISKIQHLPCADLWTYSFPCQDISVAGKGLGIKKGTRSGLLFEVERLLEVAISNNTQPNYLLLENVKNLVGKRNIDDFNLWLKKLDEFGYNTYWQVINGKNCGIPQNRERVFAISIRKNIDTCSFEFNKPFDNGIRLKDILEYEVDEKYYISDDKLDRFITEFNSKNTLMYDSYQIKRVGRINSSQDGLVINPSGIAPTHTAGHGNCPKIIQVGNYKEPSDGFDNPQTGRVYSPNGISPTLNTMQGGDRQPKILEDFYSNRDIRQYEDYSPTLRSERNGLKVANIRIRKLTPTECFRLMGFKDEDIKRCINMDISDTQLYKQAGNSIITYCIMLLMEHLYKAQYNNAYVCTDEKILNGDVVNVNFTQPQAV